MDDFESFGSFMQAVATAANGPRAPGLRWAAATGAGETVPHEGGFAVPVEFAVDLLERTYATGALLRRTNRLPMQSNQLRVPIVDETSRANGSRFGGIALTWMQAEGDEITGTKPKLAARTLAVKKLAGLCYVTAELFEDAPALGAILTRLFTLEASFRIEREIVAGGGSAGPLGILNAGCTIDVAAESGQSAATILAANVVNMYARLWSGSKERAVWLVNTDVFPQLLGLTWTTGTGVVPLFRWGADGTPLLMGRPVVETEYNATLGARGDIILCDLSEFILGDRTDGLQTDLSLHVKFVLHEGAYRFIWRTDGHPAWSSPTTPLNGTATVSPFVTLAARA